MGKGGYEYLVSSNHQHLQMFTEHVQFLLLWDLHNGGNGLKLECPFWHIDYSSINLQNNNIRGLNISIIAFSVNFQPRRWELAHLTLDTSSANEFLIFFSKHTF